MRWIVALLLFPSVVQAQWLPEADQKRERDLWASTGVEMPEGLQFYSLQKVSQRLVTINDRESYGIFSDKYDGDNLFPVVNVNRQLPWKTPAGLHWSPADQWRSAKAAYFPSPIKVYRHRVGVLNSFGNRQPQMTVAWEFPNGTIFAEILIRRHEGHEWPFEIRVREKHDGKWDDGVTYRPSFDGVQAIDLDAEVPAGKLTDFGVPEWIKMHNVKRLPKGSLFAGGAFRATRHTMTANDDNSAVPRGFMGNVTRCATCHQRAGESTSYGATAISGSDSILSWQPFRTDTMNTDAYPVLDSRWPLINAAGLQQR